MSSWSEDRPLEVLTLDLQGQIFALEAAQVFEILDFIAVTEVPGSRPFVNGLINVRGKVVPLADLRFTFGMEQKTATIDTRVVVIEMDFEGEPLMIGLLADKVHEVTEIAAAALEETPRIGLKWPPEFIRCVGKVGGDFVAVLDIERILSDASKETIH